MSVLQLFNDKYVISYKTSGFWCYGHLDWFLQLVNELLHNISENMWSTSRHLVKRSCDKQEAELDMKIKKSSLLSSSTSEEVMSSTDSPKEKHLNMVSHLGFQDFSSLQGLNYGTCDSMSLITLNVEYLYIFLVS